MLGYDTDCKETYIVLRLRDRKVLSRKDCVFDENDINNVLVDEEALEEIYDDLLDFPEPDFDEHLDDIVYDEELAEADQDFYDPDLEEAEELDAEAELIEPPPGYEPYWNATAIEESPPRPSCDLERWYHDVFFAMVGLALPAGPRDIEEALAMEDSDLWAEAIRKELHQFDSRNTLKVASQQHGRAMKMKFVLKYKFNPDYTLVRKARLVICGYSQIKGIDYNETYAPTTTNCIVFMILQLACMFGFAMAIFDVGSAFLEGENDVVLYARLPKELSTEEHPDGLRVQVMGSVYGEKQAPKIWNDKLDRILVVMMGFERCPVSPCLYYKFAPVGFIVLTVHVDDGNMFASSKTLLTEFHAEFQKHVRKVEMSDTFARFLGMDMLFNNESNEVYVSMSNYIEDRFKEYDKTVRTPLSNTTNLRVAKPNPDNPSLLPVTGALRFPADRCRPDILVAVGEMSSGASEGPSDEHMKVADRCRNYLMSTRSLGMLFGGNPQLCLFGYSDASYITEGNSKSRLGGCLFLSLYSGAIMSYSVNDTSISTLSHSSAEAEIKGIDKMVQEIIHVREVLTFLHCKPAGPTPLYIDASSSKDLIETLKTGHKTKHINMRINFIREQINAGVIALILIPGTKNVADVLTKGLSNDPFESHIEILMHGHRGVPPHGDEVFPSSLFEEVLGVRTVSGNLP
jgi:hypothetical protein